MIVFYVFDSKDIRLTDFTFYVANLLNNYMSPFGSLKVLGSQRSYLVFGFEFDCMLLNRMGWE